jgi:hypothetical protein
MKREGATHQRCKNAKIYGKEEEREEGMERREKELEKKGVRWEHWRGKKKREGGTHQRCKNAKIVGKEEREDGDGEEGERARKRRASGEKDLRRERERLTIKGRRRW